MSTTAPETRNLGSGLPSRPSLDGPLTPNRRPPAGNETPRRSTKRWVVGLGLAVVLLVGAVAVVANPFAGPDRELVYYTVTVGDLPINVTERGTLESQENVEVLCEVDDLPDDGIRGTPIRWIVTNGATVKKGELIVELEDQGQIERRDRQILAREKALAMKIEAEAKYDNQMTQNETLEADAALAVELADLELEMFQDEENGTHKLEVEDIRRLIDDINSQILAAQAQLELATKDMRASESLFKMGYAGKSDLERSKLEVLKAESEYASKMNSLRTQIATLKKKQTYEKRKQVMTLEGALATARRQLIQVKRDNVALLAQAKAQRDAAIEAFKKEDELLTRYNSHVTCSKIYAPASGMVSYAVKDSRRWWEDEIGPGKPVRTKQVILSIPNLRKMQVRTEVNEAVIDQVRKGLDATVRLEAFPDRLYSARVESVGVLPAPGNSETRVYETIVTIDGEVEGLKPGMNAIVDIHVARLKDVVSVPVQAVIQIGSDSWCYVDNGGEVERRTLELGLTNHKFVEVRQGLQAGDRVVLNPMDLVEETEKKKSPLAPPGSQPAPETGLPSEAGTALE